MLVSAHLALPKEWVKRIANALRNARWVVFYDDIMGYYPAHLVALRSALISITFGPRISI